VRILDNPVGLIFLAVHLTRAVVKTGNQQDISADVKIRNNYIRQQYYLLLVADVI
jgi:hypothetical protein